MPDTRANLVEIARSLREKIGYRGYRSPYICQNPDSGLNCYGFISFGLSKLGFYLPRGTGIWEMGSCCQKPMIPK